MKKNLGILIIDMQDKFLDKIPYGEKSTLIKTQLKLLDYAKKTNIPIATLVYLNEEKTIKELSGVLDKMDNTYINKYNDNGFIHPNIKQFSEFGGYSTRDLGSLKINCPENKDLIDFLKKKKITDIILTGVFREDCVKATTGGAIKKKYSVYTCEELMDNPPLKTDWFHENSNHYDSLGSLLENINQNL